MSDILQNALRYNSANTRRNDGAKHNGEVVDEKSGAIGFDCSGYICHVMIESGYLIDYEPTFNLKTTAAFATADMETVKPGDIVLYEGHGGIVIEYDHTKYLGRFVHMSSHGLMQNYFVTRPSQYMEMFHQSKKPKDPNGDSIYWGVKQKFLAFRRINPQRYNHAYDQHPDGTNPNPVLRPLGTRVYTNVMDPPKKTVAKLRKKTQSAPHLKKEPPEPARRVTFFEQIEHLLTGDQSHRAPTAKESLQQLKRRAHGG